MLWGGLYRVPREFIPCWKAFFFGLCCVTRSIMTQSLLMGALCSDIPNISLSKILPLHKIFVPLPCNPKGKQDILLNNLSIAIRVNEQNFQYWDCTPKGRRLPIFESGLWRAERCMANVCASFIRNNLKQKDMKRNLLLLLMALLPMATLITITSCGDDDEIVQPPVNNNSNNGSNTDDNGSGDNNGDNSDSDNNGQEVPDIVVVVNEDGTTSNGSIFSAIDDKNFYIDYIKYTVEEGHLVVSGYDKTGFKGVANIITRLTYKGNTYEVFTIGKEAFKFCSNLTSVTIPNNVTSIGEWAFDSCKSLFSVTMPSSVTSIGEYAFYLCNRLTSVTIGNGVTSIGDYAFEGCTSLTSVIIGNSVTSIGRCAFRDCTSLTSIHISDLASWCNISFSGFTSNPLYYAHHLYVKSKEITDLVIPEGVTSISDDAFSSNALTSVSIPNSVTSIGPETFYDCWFVKNKFINNSTLTDSNNWGATLCDIETSEGLLITDNTVFRCRPWATSITIPNNVTSIGNSAFRNCTSLISVTIPNSVTSIGFSAFLGCSELTSITIPNSVTSIGGSAFSNCSSLTAMTIPNCVTSIGDHAFYGCSGLTSVNIPNSVTSIGYAVFCDCSNLTTVTIGCSVTSIGNYAFYGCSSLTSVKVKATTPPTVDYSTFSNRSNKTLYVPLGCKAAYQADWFWQGFKSIIETEMED